MVTSYEDKMETPYVWRRKNRQHPETGKAPISIRIEIKGFPRAEYQTDIKATEQEWSSALGRKKELRTMSKEEQALVRQENDRLTDLCREFRQLYHNLSHQGGNPSPAQLRDIKRGKKGTQDADRTIQSIMLQLRKKREEDNRTQGTLRIHDFIAEVFSTYQKESKALQTIQHIDRPWLRAFERWCIAHPYSFNTIHGFFQMLREVIGYAMDEGWIRENPLFQYRMILKRTVTKRQLSAAEVTMLAGTCFPNHKLQMVAHIFLFSCYTGLAFADYTRFAKGPDEFISYEPDPAGRLVKGFDMTRQKMLYKNTAHWVPLFPEAQGLLSLYANKLPITSQSTVSRRLKVIAKQLDLSLPDLKHKDARSTFAQMMRDRYGKAVAASLAMHSEEMAQKHYSSESAQSLLRELSILGAPLTHN